MFIYVHLCLSVVEVIIRTWYDWCCLCVGSDGTMYYGEWGMENGEVEAGILRVDKMCFCVHLNTEKAEG